MALSNWDTLAVEFDVTERVLPRELASPAADELNAAIEEMLAPLRELQENRSPEAEAAVEELMNSSVYSDLISREVEARTVREAKVAQSDGCFRSPTSDLSVEIYKNWAYLRSSSMWSKDTGFVEPTIAQLSEGDVKLGGLQIVALRGPQEGIVLLAYTNEYGEDDEGSHTRSRGILGTGVYGYDDSEFVGVLPETVEWIRARIGDELPAFLGALDLGEAQRFNQGDAFFADEFGIETPSAAPGDVDEPIITDAIRGLGAENKD